MTLAEYREGAASAGMTQAQGFEAWLAETVFFQAEHLKGIYPFTGSELIRRSARNWQWGWGA
jgi:hypothetical protein